MTRPKKSKKARQRRCPPVIDPVTSLMDEAVQCLSMGNFERASYLFQTILHKDPQHAEAHIGLGLIAFNIGQLYDAAILLSRAQELAPNNVDAHRNLGLVLSSMWRLDRAKECAQRTLELSPNCAIGHMLMGTILGYQGQHRKAIPHLKESLKLRPGVAEVLNPLMTAHAALCEWDDLDRVRTQLLIQCEQRINAGQKTPVAPFHAVTSNFPTPLITSIARNQALQAGPGSIYPSRKLDRTPEGKLRIGYISPDMYNHPVGLLMAPIFEKIDHNAFETHVYALRHIDDQVQERIDSAVDKYHNLDGLSDQQIADYIYQDQIHILVDLAGFTNSGRPGVLSRRPAPVQVHYLGYPGTMTRRLVDYQIAHPSRVTEEDYDEALAFLPETFIASEGFPKPEKIPTRIDLGLPEDKFLYSFFGASYRIDQEVFSAWMHILKQVPNSALMIQNGEEEVQNRLRGYARAYGVDDSRIYFTNWGLLSEHWHHQLSDLWIDGWHVSSGTASIVGLWTGTPLLCWKGDSPQSKTAAGVLTGAQLPEFIASTKEEYVARAIHWGKNPEELKELRAQLQQRTTQMPLFQVERFTKYLEQAYSQMWSRFEKGLTPKSFLVGDEEESKQEAEKPQETIAQAAS